MSSVWEPNEDRGPISQFAMVPRHRLELRAGKMSTADIFDINPSASDSHMQFMNWTVTSNTGRVRLHLQRLPAGACSFVAEYQGRTSSASYGLMLMPKIANGLDLDWHLSNSRADNLELELKYSRRPDWHGTLRLLGYLNHADVGSYADAIAASEATGLAPDVTACQGRGGSGGFGINGFGSSGLFPRAFVPHPRVERRPWQGRTSPTRRSTAPFAIGGDVRGARL